MSFFSKLFGGGLRGRKGKGEALESILIVEDRELYIAIWDASEERRRLVSLEVVHHAVGSVGLRHPAVQEAVSCLESGERPSAALVSAVQGLADDLDIEYWRLQEERECEETGEEELAAFHRARAASCILAAFSGRADEAVYEAIHATEDLPKVREIVLSALKGT